MRQITHNKALLFCLSLALILGLTTAPMKAQAAGTGSTKTVKVVTYNVLTTEKTKVNAIASRDTSQTKRFKYLTEFLKTEAPDSIGLNEVSDTSNNYGGNTWTQQLQDIVARSDVHYAIAGLTANNGEQLLSGSKEYSPVLYNTDKYTVFDDEQGGFWLSSTPMSSAYKYSGMKFRRVFSYAVLRDKNTLNPVYIHISAHYDQESDSSVNVKCSEVVLNIADQLETAYGCPVVVSGDFNCLNTSAEYKAYKDHGYKSLEDMSTLDLTKCSSHPGYNKATTYAQGSYPADKAGVIDHIFVGSSNSASGLTLGSYSIVDNYYFSDHSAIMGTFSFTQTYSTYSPKTARSGNSAIEAEDYTYTLIGTRKTNTLALPAVKFNTNAQQGKCINNAVYNTAAVYKNISFNSTVSGVRFRISRNPNTCGGTINVFLYDNGVKGAQVASLTVNDSKCSGTTDYDTYRSYDGVLSNASQLTGNHDLIVEFAPASGKKFVCELDYFYFKK